MITIGSLLNNVGQVANRAISLLFVIATLVFLWGIIRYVIAGEDEEKLKEGRQYIIYGLIGLAVMLAVWGIVGAVVKTLFG